MVINSKKKKMNCLSIKKEKSAFILTALVLSIMIIFFAPAIAFAQKDNTASSYQSKINSSNGFNTYTNSKFNISINYPKGWEAIENNLPFSKNTTYPIVSFCPSADFPGYISQYTALTNSTFMPPPYEVTDFNHDVFRCIQLPAAFIVHIKEVTDMNKSTTPSEILQNEVSTFANSEKNRNITGEMLKSNIILHGQPAVKLTYSFDNSGIVSKIEVMTVKDNKIYSIQYTGQKPDYIDLKSNFDVTMYEPLIQKMIESFQITG